MKVSELNGYSTNYQLIIIIAYLFANRVKIYDLSSGKTEPEYMAEAHKKKVKLNNIDEYRNRIELL